MRLALEKIDQLVQDEYAFFVREKQAWSLTAGPQDLELVAHALRVILHARSTSDFLDDYLALVDCQARDGGWSSFSADRESTVWVSAFCGLMLIRGNRFLQQDRLSQAVYRTIDYFLDTQHADGRWVDPSWADLDTTSHPISFFNVVMALGSPIGGPKSSQPGKREPGLFLTIKAPMGAGTMKNSIPRALRSPPTLFKTP
jgi:hypothetical protein